MRVRNQEMRLIEWLFTIAGCMLLLCGAWIALWWGWRDTGKRKRRCPKCWYDMSATAGLKCPECGREAKSERRLFRTHRKWRWVLAGLLMVAASYPVFKWPLYQRSGAIGFVPRMATIAFAPELSTFTDRWSGPNSRPTALIVDKVFKVQPPDRAERVALAWMIGRVLRDPAKRQRDIGELMMMSFWHLGDQAAMVAEDLAVALASKSTVKLMWGCERLPLTTDDRFKALVCPAVDAVLDGREKPFYDDGLLDRLQGWGASVDDLRETALFLIEHPRNPETPDSRAIEFLWRENLIRPEDTERVKAWRRIRVWAFALYASYAAAELHEFMTPIIPEIQEAMKVDDLQEISDWTVFAVAMSEDAAALLPAFDRIAAIKKYPSFRVCGTIGGLAIRGFSREAYQVLWLELQRSQNGNATEYPQRYKIAPIMLYLDVPDEMKAEGLAEVLRLERSDGGGGLGVGQATTHTVDSLGKLGKAARGAVEPLIDAIQPGAQSNLVERILRALEKIGPLTKDQIQTLDRNFSEWTKTTVDQGNAMFWHSRILRQTR